MTNRSRRRIRAALGVVGAVAALVTALGAWGRHEPNPLHGATFYVNPEGQAVRQATTLHEAGDVDGAARLRLLAEQPTAVWFTGGDTDPRARAADLTESAASAGHVPVLVAYNIPGRDCGQHSRGGATGAEQYRAWLTLLATGIGDHEAVVILEPDTVAHAVTGCAGSPSAASRYDLLDEAVTILTALAPRAHVYIDAGHSAWVRDLPALAGALRRAGVERAAGFSLNVSNYQTTEESARYGQALSDLLHGARFVIDTSRNGNGPVLSPASPEEAWCNPPGRRMGARPTSSPGIDRVDALLWVKQPGESDGTCRGGPPAGTWWPAAARELAGPSGV